MNRTDTVMAVVFAVWFLIAMSGLIGSAYVYFRDRGHDDRKQLRAYLVNQRRINRKNPHYQPPLTRLYYDRGLSRRRNP